MAELIAKLAELEPRLEEIGSFSTLFTRSGADSGRSDPLRSDSMFDLKLNFRSVRSRLLQNAIK